MEVSHAHPSPAAQNPIPTLAFLHTALLSTLCTLALLHHLAVRYRLHIVALALGYGAGFVGVMVVVRVMG